MNFSRNAFYFFAVLAILWLTACSGAEQGEAAQAIQMPESPLLRMFERKSGRILYMGVDGNLYTINQAGEDSIQITSNANPDAHSADYRGYLQFAWAPNSEKIAFVGYDREKVSLFTTNADGQELNTAFSTDSAVPVFLYWTPDSTKIGILANKLASTELNVHLATVDGHEEAKTIGDGEPYFWSWGPQGDAQFLAHIGSGDTSRLVMASSDADRSFEWRVRPGIFKAPAWSPDGAQIIVAVEETPSRYTLVVTDLQGKITQTIASIEDSVAFGWSPTGQHIAYVMSQNSRGTMLGKLVVQELDQPENKIEVAEPFVVAYFWSPDGKKLAYFTLELAPGEPDAATETQQNTYVAMGLYMLDIKSGKSTNLLYFMPTPSFSNLISFFDQYQQAVTIWSPDSENLVISAVAEDGVTPRIVVVPASGTLPTREIADGLLAFWSWK